MGCKIKKRRSSEDDSKVRYQQVSACHCAQLFDSSTAAKNFPPPDAPDGRPDLWELQFCRWWGWNWVRKKEPEKAMDGEHTQTSFTSKHDRDTIDEQVQSSDKCDPCPGPDPGASRPKRTSFSNRAPDVRPCEQPQVSAKEQFITICKCLLGKKQKCSDMAKLYNTPSGSVATIMQERSCRGSRTKKSKRDSSQEKHRSRRERSRGHSGKRVYESTRPPPSEQRPIISDIHTKKSDSSSEGSVEYLTFRLQHMTGESGCLCGTQNAPMKVQGRPVAVATEQVSPPKQVKETQTHVKEKQEQQTSTVSATPPSATENCRCGYSEKSVKLKGKKQKRICIMVCCCGSCQQDNKQANQQHPGLCPKKNCPAASNSTVKPERDYGGGKAETHDKYSTFPPTTVNLLSTKMLSKFGTPSQNYPWMQSSASAVTTTSLNTMGNWLTSSNDVLDWLNPKLDLTDQEDSLNLPDLMDITENLAYLKKLDATNKSKEEDRILLDAVCDAILREHDQTTSELLQELHEKGNHYYKELGVLCNLQNDYNYKIDAYTEGLVDMEDVGVQLSKAINLESILERSNASRLDTVMNDIMENIFSESKEGLEMSQYNLSKTSTDQESSKTTFRKPLKRGATCSEKSKNCYKKKLKQETTHAKIDDVFAKIESIVAKSKAKTAEMQREFNFVAKKSSEEVLQIQHSCDDMFGCEALTNTTKRNYPMSSDTFKGTICDNISILEDQEGENTDSPNEKLSKLSVHSFIVCNEKSKIESQSSPACFPGRSTGGKPVKTNSSRVSLIPVRRRNNTLC